MRILYNGIIQLVTPLLKGLSFFSPKIAQGVAGRAETFAHLTRVLPPEKPRFWFHCASLGEYEQGVPLFEVLRAKCPNHYIVLSFFSPSGYRAVKNSPLADTVVYLPIDTKHNAQKFVTLVKPQLTVFVKYDIWPNYLAALQNQQRPALLISALFRENQLYFKWYGVFFKKALLVFQHIFTQDAASAQKLQSIGYTNVTVAGDTRFDRVLAQLSTDNELDFAAIFKNNKLCIIAGSTWEEDDALWVDFINKNPSDALRFIMVPHEINAHKIQSLARKIESKTLLYSERNTTALKTSRVLILDTVGLLKSIYSYADIAYVGGAMGNTGLHNILEPAVFGIPIIIGSKHQKFPEAHAMITQGGVFSISDTETLREIVLKLIEDKPSRIGAGLQNVEFVKNNTGAVTRILDYIEKRSGLLAQKSFPS